ncbi:MAG: M23 family metallopeptidase [Candidatus Eremiobacteraeota bacterium]|uniref:Putative Peptidase M23B n=1 Tax=mine drainage metagenome TaxID=410659 RepID=E6PDT4_9ZZZZ|nr:M23 family metallopeptidase [Candidatus Eremiobacteraeota bacterium]
MFLDRYHVKLVPQNGERIWRFVLSRRSIVIACTAFASVVMGSATFALVTAGMAHHEVAHLRAVTMHQSRTVTSIDRQTEQLRATLERVERENQRIEAAIGMPVHASKPVRMEKKASRGASKVSLVRARLREIAAVAARAAALSQRSRARAVRVLNLGNITALAQAALVAHIPSIDPVAGAQITGCFCYRTYPDVEFHEGVDLAADWGEPVRATAAGVVTAASYDGGYGLMVDIDHENGYVTWYAHLSSTDVRVGEHVLKGQRIGRVGMTGFATGPHVHYQVMHDGTPVDPTPFLDGIPRNVIADRS